MYDVVFFVKIYIVVYFDEFRFFVKFQRIYCLLLTFVNCIFLKISELYICVFFTIFFFNKKNVEVEIL